MTFLEFILSYSILLVLSGIFIASWFNLTRHSIIIQPDNTEKHEGLLFYRWSAFWEKIEVYNQTTYEGEALADKFKELTYLHPHISKKIELQEDGMMAVKEGQIISIEEIEKIERSLGINVNVTEEFVFFYIDDPIYKFPSWVRNPISQCLYCMPSVYGTPIYLGFSFLIKDAYSWTSHKNLAILLLFPLFIIILSSITSFLSRKFN